jgi:hypothetical protein
LQPISLGEIQEKENPYIKKEKLNLRDFFHLDKEETTSSSEDHPSVTFSSSTEVQQFFSQVGQNLLQPPVDPDLATLTPYQQAAYTTVCQSRKKAYQSLNQDIYSTFSKLFFYMNY